MRYLVSAVSPFQRAMFQKSLDELERYLQRNQKSKVLSAFLSVADTLVHAEGLKGAQLVLSSVDQVLARHPEVTEGRKILIFSDHGMAQSRNGGLKFFDLHELLNCYGFRPVKKIRSEREYLMPFLAQVSYVGLTCTEASRRKLTNILIEHDAVDHVIYESQKRMYIIGKEGRGRLTRLTPSNGNEVFEYAYAKNDPLKSGMQGVFTNADAFAETCAGEFPDALERIVEAFTGVRAPSNLLVNLNQEYYAGSKRVNRVQNFLGMLRATHGSLSAEQTNGILLTNCSEMEKGVVLHNGKRYLRIRDLNLRHYLDA